MSAAVTKDMIHAVVQQIQANLADMRFDVRALKAGMTAIQVRVGNFTRSVAGLNRRMDSPDERMGRVERRLDLTDHH